MTTQSQDDEDRIARGRRPPWRRRAIAACATVALVAVAGCGGSEPSTERAAVSDAANKSSAVFEKFNGMSGQARTDALVAAAQEEGSVTVYTSNTDIDLFAEGFEEKYGITVDTYRASSDTLLQRLLQEQKAGYYGADVVEDAVSAVVAREGLAGEYVNDELTSQIRGFDPEAGFIPSRIGAYVVAWNTDAVSDDEVPATLEGFTDPKWEGRLSMEIGDWAWYLGMHDHLAAEGQEDAQIGETFQTLAEYTSSVISGHPLQSELLAAGEFDVALSSYPHYYPELQEGGAPVTFQKEDGSLVEPIVAVNEGSALLKTAPHPAAAQLFIDYMLTDGQKIMVDEARVPSVPQPNDGFADTEFQFVDPDEFYEKQEQWDADYRELLAGREVIE